MATPTINNLNPDNRLMDCCDGGGNLGTASAYNKRLFLTSSCCKKQSPILPVEADKSFFAGELVKIVAGTITKLTAAPIATDILGLTVYSINNTTVEVTAGRGQPKATVYISADGINEEAIVMPAGVVIDDALRSLMASKGLSLQKLYKAA